MSRAGLLERLDVDLEDDWIENVAPVDPEPATVINAAPGAVVFAAIETVRNAVDQGDLSSLMIDTDDFGAIDEIDDAAIREFFRDAE